MMEVDLLRTFSLLKGTKRQQKGRRSRAEREENTPFCVQLVRFSPYLEEKMVILGGKYNIFTRKLEITVA
jgi:hypothetical protein